MRKGYRIALGIDAADARRKTSHLLGVVCFHVQDLDNAKKHFEEAKLRDWESVELEQLLAALGIDATRARANTQYLLGLVYFHLQDWTQAKNYLDQALQASLQNLEMKQQLELLLERVKTNESTLVHCPMHVSKDFNREELLKPPALALSKPDSPEEALKTGRRGVLGLAHRAVSFVGGLFIDVAIALVYATRKRKPIFAFESWDERHPFLGSLELGGIRKDLNGEKLQSTYDGLVGRQPPGQKRPEWTKRIRTATGAWTTDDPMEGAAGTEIQRTGWPVGKRVDRSADPTLPNAREVSRLILAPEKDKPQKEAASLNLLTIAWIQAQLHDWVSHRPTPIDGFHTVPLKSDDPLSQRYGIGALQVPKSAANPILQDGKLTFLNEVTHWWDASHIYGSDEETQDRLRTRSGDGKLRMEDRDLLPIRKETGIDDSGFTRNWWIGLDLVHTLFVKHHNYICDDLLKAYPEWKKQDDLLFHIARLINSAILAKIHTVEWTPAVLANESVVSGMLINWWGLLESLCKPFGRRRLSSTWEPVHHVLGGIAGGKRDNHGKPYGLSEEFTEIYRLHAGIPEKIALRAIGSREPSEKVPTDATRGAGAREMVTTHGMEMLFNSFGHQHMPALVHNNYPAFMCEMSIEGQSVIDIGTIDILRGRERGVLQYNDFRRMLGLKPITRFEDLGCSAETVHKLKTLYGKGEEGVEKLDLLAGTCCELWRPEGFGFGETMFTVFIQMASRRLQADPFYTEKFNERYYTKKGMELIEQATMKSVLLLHYPNLAKTGLMGVHNAFEPWGTTAATHPQEHPLAAIEKY